MPATRRRISTSTPRPLARWKETISVRVRASVTAGSTPVHSATSIAGPNRSTAWPLVRTRDSGIRSTTVTANPCRDSQYAAVGPATLAPEIRTRNADRHVATLAAVRDVVEEPPGSWCRGPLLVDHSVVSFGGTRHCR